MAETVDDYSKELEALKHEFGIPDEVFIGKIDDDYKELIDELREDPEYIRLKNMPLELIQDTKEFNTKMYHDIRAYNKINPIAPKVVVTNEQKQKEVLRCKYDILYYARNYVVVSGVGGDQPFLLSQELEIYLRLFEASMLTLFMTSRQSLTKWTLN